MLPMFMTLHHEGNKLLYCIIYRLRRLVLSSSGLIQIDRNGINELENFKKKCQMYALTNSSRDEGEDDRD